LEAYVQIVALLKKYKCKHLRRKNHDIYLLPSGVRYTLVKTPGDHHAWNNSLAQLKTALGISKRGKVAKVGIPSPKPAKAPPSTSSQTHESLQSLSPSPRSFDFREKLRAAMKGEKLSSETSTLPVKSKSPKKETIVKYRAPRRYVDRERDGVGRVWSKEDIEAANIAMRVGKLDEFMQNRYAASRPEAAILNNQPKEEIAMLAVEQIDATIQELDEGMAVANRMAEEEAATIRHLEEQMEQSRQRLQAANDKSNSLNDVKNSLGVIRSDIERVRPMLGLLAHKTPTSIEVRTRARASGAMKVADAVAFVLDRAEVPLRCAEIHAAITKIHGCEGVAKASVSTFLSQDKQHNGSAVARHLADIGAYWRATRPLPQQGGPA
jgi:hypothetical protein